MKKQTYYIMVAIGVLSVSMSPIITRFSSSPAIVTAANRMLYTLVLLTPFTLRTVIGELKLQSSRNLWLNILSGIFLGLHFWTWIASLQYTSVANSTILVNLNPLFILILSRIFLGQPITKVAMLSTAIALSGSVMLLYHSLFNLSLNPKGDLLAIVGALTVSIYFMVGAHLRKSLTTKTYTYIAYLAAFMTLLVIASLMRVNIFAYPKADILVFLGLALFPTLLGHSLFSLSLKMLSPHFISMAVLGEPIIASLWAVALFNEPIGTVQLIGGALILTGLTLKILSGR